MTDSTEIWALTRVSGPDPTAVELGYAAVSIDPVSQMAIYHDVRGQLVEPIEAAKHGSATNTYPPTQRSKDGKDGPRSDPDTGHDGDRD